MCSVLQAQILSGWKRIPFLFNLSESKRERDKVVKILHGETERVIRLRRDLLHSMNLQKVSDADENEFGIKRRLAFLDILLLSQMEGAKLTDANIREEVDTFMFEVNFLLHTFLVRNKVISN